MVGFELEWLAKVISGQRWSSVVDDGQNWLEKSFRYIHISIAGVKSQLDYLQQCVLVGLKETFHTFNNNTYVNVCIWDHSCSPVGRLANNAGEAHWFIASGNRNNNTQMPPSIL